MAKLDRLFAPRSIAVVGVSADPLRPGSQAVRALLGNGYRGAIYPVNPRYPSHQGLPCFSSLAAIGAEIDLAVVAIPAPAVPAVIAQCAAQRVPYAVILSGGFGETGARGAALQEEIVAAAARGGTRLVGPNCLGIASIPERVYAAFGSITRPPRLTAGPVSLVTQSGGFGYSIALACAQAGVGFRRVIATGNEADLDTIDFLEALIEDEGTRLVIAYLEGLREGRALIELGRHAHAAGKPLLVWKGGVTGAGKRAAATHTANLTGSYDYFRAAFAQAGIIEIREIHEAADLARALLAGKFPEGRRVAVMGGSGGSAIVFADAAEQSGLALARLSRETRSRLAKVVPDIGSVENPVDFTAGFIASAGGGRFRAAVEAVLEDPRVDAVCVNLATIENAPARDGAQVLGDLARTTSKPLLAFLSTPPEAAPDALAALAAGNVPAFPSPVRMARTLAALARYREFGARAGSEESCTPAAAAPIPPQARRLSEPASKAILSACGIAVTREVVVQSAEEVPFEFMDLPLAVKIASPDIAHKTDIGAVRLGVHGREALAAAIAGVLDAAHRHAPEATIEGVVVAEMVGEGHELLAGAVNDPVFGPVVVLGAGGLHAETLADTTCRIAPFGPATALEMVDDLRCAPILRGARAGPAANLAELARTLALLSAFAWENRDTLGAVDINPLIVTARGAIAADALIVGRGLKVAGRTSLTGSAGGEPLIDADERR